MVWRVQVHQYSEFSDVLEGLEDYIVADLVAVMARVRAVLATAWLAWEDAWSCWEKL